MPILTEDQIRKNKDDSAATICRKRYIELIETASERCLMANGFDIADFLNAHERDEYEALCEYDNWRL